MSTDAANTPATPMAAPTPLAAATAPPATAIPPDATLPDDPDTLKAMIRELLDLLRSRDRELSGVQHRLDQLLRRLYGPKSEKFRPDQPDLFELLGLAEPTAEPPSASDPEPAARAPKKGHGRRPLPA